MRRGSLHRFDFAKLCLGLLGALKATDGHDGGGEYVTMAFAHARFSACAHGGPLGHDYITLAPSALVIASTADRSAAAWVSALTMALAKLRGPNHVDAKAALAIQHASVLWAAGPRGPLAARQR